MKDDPVYIAHMLECIGAIEQYAAVGRERFMSEPMVSDAVLRRLQTMAESAKHLSEDFKKRAPQVDWRAIVGFHNVLVHDYLGVDLNRIWRIITIDLPKLKEQLQAGSG